MPDNAIESKATHSSKLQPLIQTKPSWTSQVMLSWVYLRGTVPDNAIESKATYSLRL